MAESIIQVEEDSPLRCQMPTAIGQCRAMISHADSKYCPMHAGMGNQVAERQKVRNYRLERFQARVESFADNDQIKSLREEIGIMRMMIEELLLSCQNDNTQLLLMSNRISDLVMKCEKLVSSCHRIELSTGMLLDKAALFQLANVLVDIIGNHIDDDDKLAVISEKILKAIGDSKPLLESKE